KLVRLLSALCYGYRASILSILTYKKIFVLAHSGKIGIVIWYAIRRRVSAHRCLMVFYVERTRWGDAFVTTSPIVAQHAPAISGERRPCTEIGQCPMVVGR